MTSARLSPQGDRLLVGGHYGFAVDTNTNININPVFMYLPALACNARAAYSEDGALVATSEPRLFSASDFAPIWTAAGTSDAGDGDFLDDVQFRPNASELLVSHVGSSSHVHALYSLTDGSLLRAVPELQGSRAKFSPEGNWVVSGATLLHLPDGEQRAFDPQSVLATFAPNGDIVALLADGSLTRYCRAP